VLVFINYWIAKCTEKHWKNVTSDLVRYIFYVFFLTSWEITLDVRLDNGRGRGTSLLHYRRQTECVANGRVGDCRPMHTCRTCVTYLPISYELSFTRAKSLFNLPTRWSLLGMWQMRMRNIPWRMAELLLLLFLKAFAHQLAR